MATLITLVTGFGLAFSAGGDGRGGMSIWPVLIPLVFVFFVSMYAAIIQLGTYIADGQWLLVVIDVIILIAAVWVVLAAVNSMVRTRNQPLDLDAKMDDIEAGTSV